MGTKRDVLLLELCSNLDFAIAQFFAANNRKKNVRDNLKYNFWNIHRIASNLRIFIGIIQPHSFANSGVIREKTYMSGGLQRKKTVQGDFQLTSLIYLE